MVGYHLKARRLGIETPNEAHIFMHKDCHVCRAEGFAARTSIVVANGPKSVIATLYHVTGKLVGQSEAGLSEWAWNELGLTEGNEVTVSHAPPLESLSQIRGKVHGRKLDALSLRQIIADIAGGRYSGIHLSALLPPAPLVDSTTKRFMDSRDRKSVVEGKGVNLGGRRIVKEEDEIDGEVRSNVHQ